MIYFIVNITARTGKSRAIWIEMKEILENRSIEYKAFQTRYAGHATDLARKISSLPEDRIYLITVGGDGTLNEVINGITDFSRIVLGILPIGSGNDFARGMGVSKDTLSNLEQMLDLIESASEGTAIDLVKSPAKHWIHRNICPSAPVPAWMLLSARRRCIPGLRSF